jgi:flavin reductase (DIM6/NTAB) family NADH-FMN oxidoreductase RutF
MSLAHQLRDALIRSLLGETNLPQGCNIALRDPQTEIVVWLHGMDAPRDVTHCHTVACVSPPMVCIGFGAEENLEEKLQGRLSLSFCERGNKHPLGKMKLFLSTILPVAGVNRCLFTVKSCSNYCLPRRRMWAHYMHHAYLRWRNRKTVNVRISGLEDRFNAVMFICPKPVGLISVFEGNRGNIFPVNLMGPLGGGCFSFALVNTQWPAPLLKRIGRFALSDIPFDQAKTVRTLGKNHRQESIDWQHLPFATRPSTGLGNPVPAFALRVREFEVLHSRQMGSHVFFIARITSDERCADVPEFFMIHGLYAARRQAESASRRPIATATPSPQR